MTGDVFTPAMISTSGMRETGLKKCIPPTFSGRLAAVAISVIESDDVFDAYTQESEM